MEAEITRVLGYQEIEPAIYLVRVRRADTSEETLRMNPFILEELLGTLGQPFAAIVAASQPPSVA